MTRPIRPLALAVGVLAASTVLGSPAGADPAKSEPSSSGGGAPAQPAQPAPAPAPAEKPTRDAELDALKQTLEQLKKRIEELEKQKETEKPKEPETTPDPAPPPPPPPTSTGGAGATFLPNISVVGNLIARGGDTRAFPGRGRSHLEELEIAFQDAVAPKLRYDVFLSAEKEESWGLNLEEGFLTATGPLKNLNIIAGRKRQPFGRLNPLHPHQWLFITQPTSHASLLGDHGLIADGALAHYVLPIKGLYSAIEFGAWQTASAHGGHGDEEVHSDSARLRRNGVRRPRVAEEEEEEHEELGFNGGENGAYSARVHLAKSIGRNTEVELGASRYWGRGEVHDFGRRRLAVNGLDFSYRTYPGAYRRLWFLAELLAHETNNIGGDTKLRPGGYAMLAYRWNRYWEAGIRGDYSKFPFPIEGKEYGGSLFLTKYLTEQTSMRLEYRHERDSQFGASNGIFFQLLFGSGPHTHEIQ